MSQIDDVKREAARGKTAQALDQELDSALAARPPAAPEALKGALILLGDEIARMEVLAERAGDEAAAQRLAVGLGMPTYIEGVLAGDDGMLNDLLLTAEDLRDELDALPRAKGIDDPWALNPGRADG